MQSRQGLKFGQIFSSARTQIVLWYIVIMALCTGGAILAIRQALFARLEERNERSLVQELREFQRIVTSLNLSAYSSSKLAAAAIFDKYLSRNIPNEDEFLIALLDGEFYKSSPLALPEPLRLNSALVQHWAQLTQPGRGKQDNKTGTILYLAEPVKIEGETQGVFVVARSISGEYEEIDEAVLVVAEVTFVMLFLASVMAWVAAGRVLAPLRLLTETAHAISDSDLTRRIPVQGADEIAELTQTFNEMLDRLQAAFASQREFISDAGHELRTPITIIRGHLELLGDDPQERRETIELVMDELDRMSRFVDDLLLLAKAEQPDFLALQPVDLGLLTEELFTKVQALAERRWWLEAKGSGWIVADRQRLTQAVMNLAQNATQHTYQGDVIALGSAIVNNKVRLWVRDTGTGIAPLDQKRIFERFARAAKSRRRSEGAGLGLAIVRAISEAHGGWVELLSRPGVGSTFTLVIPVEPSQES